MAGDAYDPPAFDRLAEWQRSTGEPITFVALDSLELINNETLGMPARTVAEFEKQIAATPWFAAVELVSFSALAEGQPYRAALGRLHSLTATDAKLQGLFLTQTYRNLQPVLRAFDVRNQRSPVVRSLAEYLIQEIALLVAVCSEGTSIEIGFHQRGPVHEHLSSLGLPLPNLVHLSRTVAGPLLSVSDFSVSLGRTGQTIGRFNFGLGAGEVLGVIGPNGSGKTTLLRALAGHIRSKGRMLVEDRRAKGPP